MNLLDNEQRNPMNAPVLEPQTAMGEILHFGQQARIVELEAQIQQLKKENNRLKRSQNARRIERRQILKILRERDVFIRNMAQFYFSQDANSRFFAGMNLHRCVTAKEAINHWTNNGGPEDFAKKYPDAQTVIKVFRLLSATMRKV